MRRQLFKFGYGLGLLLLIVAGAEVTARVEDRLRYGTEFVASPDFDRDLFENDELVGRRGKPMGLHRKWKLNRFGFRSSEVDVGRVAGKERIMLLGSSETFGMFESPGKDYPAQLATMLDTYGDFEVINTALPGMTLKSVEVAYEQRFAKFSPDVVVVYVSPLFYLNTTTSAANGSRTTVKALDKRPVDETPPPQFRLRIELKLRDAIDKPDFWQRWVDAKALAERRAELGKDVVFTAFPERQLELFMHDLDDLVDKIVVKGAAPLLVTHAIRSKMPPTREDLAELQSALITTPQATPEIVLEFEAKVRSKMLEFAEAKQVRIIDLADALNGKREAFGDMVHFTDAGAAVAAELIAAAILDLRSTSERRPE